MLTAFQCEVVAYLGDGDIYCPGCAYNRADYVTGDFDQVPQRVVHDALAHYDLQPLIRYTVDDEWPGGLWCSECGAEIVEPSEDYCQRHDDWRHEDNSDGTPARFCEHVWQNGQDGFTDGCRFPDTVDPNPPVSRWVPCGTCGATDGEPHRENCHGQSWRPCEHTKRGRHVLGPARVLPSGATTRRCRYCPVSIYWT